jgi:hypothetical protein
LLHGILKNPTAAETGLPDQNVRRPLYRPMKKAKGLLKTYIYHITGSQRLQCFGGEVVHFLNIPGTFPKVAFKGNAAYSLEGILKNTLN